MVAKLTAIRYAEDIGFINIYLGGVGLRSANYFHQRYEADGNPFPQVSVHLDTDPNSSDAIAFPLCLRLDAGKLDAMRADPYRFGPAAARILRKYAQYLNPEDLVNGSRTIRALTQLAFAFHEGEVQGQLRKAIHALARHRIKQIVPFLVSSSGGGAGSALQILLMQRLADMAYRSFLTEGLSGELLLSPIAVVAEPYALAQKHEPIHHGRILGNAFAFRLESEWLERRNGTKYVFHLAFSNRYGTILSEPQHIHRVLGTSVYEFQRDWSEFKARFVDGPDINALGKGYVGSDLPEYAYASRFQVASNGSRSHQSNDDVEGETT